MYLPSILRSFAIAAPLALAVPNVPLQGLGTWPSRMFSFTRSLRVMLTMALLTVLGHHASVFAPTQYTIRAHQYFASNAFDFWTEAWKLHDNLARYTNDQLQNVATTYTAAAEKINEFKVTMEHVVSSTKKFGDDVRREGIDLEEFSQKLAVELNTALEELKAEFSQPLPGDETPRQAHRDKMVSSALSKVEDAFVKVSTLWGVSEADSRGQFEELEPHVKRVLFISGQLIDDHPILVETVLFAGAALLIPEAWLLRPLLSLFGFGPYGPVKGSTAAWSQSKFWGATVTKGSWFSRLQAAGMKKTRLCKTVGGSLCVGAGLWAALSGLCG